MVINSQDQITEAVAYQAYGAMIPLDSIANAPEIPAREKFTGKEFDTEGEDSANGVAGIQVYHFGARVYDPDVGVWLSVDPKEQLFYRYGYSTSPVNTVDPDGQFIWSLINTAAQWYVGNAITQGSLNPGKWNWDDPMLMAGTMITAMGMIGAAGNYFENLANRGNSTTFAEDGSTAKYTEMEPRQPNAQEQSIVNDFYGSDNKYMQSVRENWNSMNTDQRIASLREGIQDYDLKGIPGKDLNTTGYMKGAAPYRCGNGNIIFKSTTTGHSSYVDHIHSQRISSVPSGRDFSNIRSGNNYYLLHNPVNGSPSVIKYGARGFWFFKSYYVQPLTITF